jgi:hypothetical protein
MIKGRKPAIEISLTDFVDFVCKAGSSKLTKVKQIKGREEYSPATDFYKVLREGIVQNHEDGGTKKELNEILTAVTDPKKVKNYTEAIEGYKKFWGRKAIKFFSPPFKHWKVGEVDVRINPELGLEYDDKFYVVKLYLKSDKLSKDKIDQILTLMVSQLRKKAQPEVRMAVLDVKNAKLFIKNDDDITLLPLLDGEARSFETIWNSIK